MNAAFRGYDFLRVRAYAGRPGNPNRIVTREIGGASLMRFPAVGYFNQAYDVSGVSWADWPEIQAFFAEAVDEFKVLVSPQAAGGDGEAGFWEENGRPVARLARMFRRLGPNIDAAGAEGVRIEPLDPREATAFFELYLEGFGARLAGWPAAVANMLQLPGRPGMHFLAAKKGGELAGLGMLHVADGVAHLCAGVVSAKYRQGGLQAALIAERLRLGAALGCDLAVAWTDAGSTSQRNLEARGFKVGYLDPVFRVSVRRSVVSAFAS